MTGSELEPQDGGALEPLSADEQALVEGIKSEISQEDLVLPAIKLTHSLTREVEEGDVQAGVYINSLTKKDYGDDAEFVVCGIYKGRFFSDERGTFVAQGDIAPDYWPEEYAGRPFADIPDAEEQWKIQANAEGGEWGQGPPIATTANFVGFVVGDESELPLRLSLMKTSMPAGRKLKTMVKALRAPWDQSFRLRVRRCLNKEQKPFYATEVAAGGPLSAEDRQRAVKIATEFRNAQQRGAVQETGDEPEPKPSRAKPKKDGDALSVD
ncbi:MAG TPA: hypothetical protein VG777_00895 [Thermoanaerobaculia bacterium]|nr:hypothetical protein [Thermoanaerobaculia bacterium]